MGGIKKLIGTSVTQKKNPLEVIPCELAHESIALFEASGKDLKSNLEVTDLVDVKQHPPDSLVDTISQPKISAPLINDSVMNNGEVQAPIEG